MERKPRTKVSLPPLEEKSYAFCLVTEPVSKKKVVDLGIPKDRIQNLSQALLDKMGRKEICRDYTVYSHWNTELTVYPDGSSFCHHVQRIPLPSSSSPSSSSPSSPSSSFLGMEILRKKIANDGFPSRHTYDSVLDTVDVVFSWSEKVEIILRLRIEESDTHVAPSTTELHTFQPPTWVEVWVKSSELNPDIYDALRFVEESTEKRKKYSKSSTGVHNRDT